MRIASNVSVLVYVQAVLSNRYFMTKRSSPTAYSCLRAVQFCTRFTGSHAASWSRGHFSDTRPRL